MFAKRAVGADRTGAAKIHFIAIRMQRHTVARLAGDGGGDRPFVFDQPGDAALLEVFFPALERSALRKLPETGAGKNTGEG